MQNAANVTYITFEQYFAYYLPGIQHRISTTSYTVLQSQEMPNHWHCLIKPENLSTATCSKNFADIRWTISKIYSECTQKDNESKAKT